MTVRDKIKEISIDDIRNLDDDGLMEFHIWFTDGHPIYCDSCRMNQGGECKLNDCPSNTELLDMEYIGEQ